MRLLIALGLVCSAAVVHVTAEGADHLAYPDKNTKQCFRHPIECPIALVGHSIGCWKHRLVFGVPRDIPSCEMSVPTSSSRLSAFIGPVLFFAKWLGTTNPGVDNFLQYTMVVENVGNGFDKATSTFTAPVAGTYFFTIQLCTLQYRVVYVILYINDSDQDGMRSCDFSSDTCRSQTLPAILSVGDTVKVKVDRYSDAGELFTQNTGKVNAFSGVLVA